MTTDKGNRMKEAHVIIETDRMCQVCRRKLGDHPVYIYPNGIVVHKACSRENLGQCPVTRRIFDMKLHKKEEVEKGGMLMS
jgi:hypothetical protein